MTDQDHELNTQGITFNVEDFSASDDNVHPHYPYEGYHRYSIRDYLTGKASPYSRATGNPAQSINTGIVFYDRHVQRMEMLINATGEAVILFRRKWSGERCRCTTVERGQPRHRCEICSGTGIIGGFTQYLNPDHPAGKVLIRIDPTVDDLILQREGVRQQGYVPQCWALPVPAIRDRDIIVRFDEDGRENWRYEVLNSTRNIGVFHGIVKNNSYLCQKFQIQRMEKTDPMQSLIYRLNYIIPEQTSSPSPNV